MHVFPLLLQQLQQVHIPGLPNPMTMSACGPAVGQRGTPFGSPVRMIGGLVTSSRPPSAMDGPLTSSRPPSAMDVKFDDEVRFSLKSFHRVEYMTSFLYTHMLNGLHLINLYVPGISFFFLFSFFFFCLKFWTNHFLPRRSLPIKKRS